MDPLDELLRTIGSFRYTIELIFAWNKNEFLDIFALVVSEVLQPLLVLVPGEGSSGKAACEIFIDGFEVGHLWMFSQCLEERFELLRS